MKIAIVVPALSNDAPVKVALSIADGMKLRGHKVVVFYMSSNVSILTHLEVDVVKISIGNLHLFREFDIVHTHMLRPDFIGFLAKLRYPRAFKLVSTLHNYFYDELENYYNKIYAIFFGNVWNFSWTVFDKLICLTDHAKDYYLKYSINKRIECVHNGHEVQICYDDFDLGIVKKINIMKAKYEYIIGTYCNLIERKGIQFLIEHIARNSKAGLVIFGNGPYKDRLVKQVEQLNVSSQVLFFDSRQDAHQYNFFFDIFAMPSKEEGFGLSLIEAALHQKSIVCSDIPVFNELFGIDEVTFFDVENESSLDNAIITSLKTNKGKKARERARKLYSTNNMCESYEKQYLKMLERDIK